MVDLAQTPGYSRPVTARANDQIVGYDELGREIRRTFNGVDYYATNIDTPPSGGAGGRGALTNLLDSIIGYDDGIETPGERLGAALDAQGSALLSDPVGMVQQAFTGAADNIAGLMAGSGTPMDALEAAGYAMGIGGLAARPAGSVGMGGRPTSEFSEYLARVNPEGHRIPAENRPNLLMGDMYGMLPENARQVGQRDGVRFYESDGNFYATAYNPDAGEMDVVGYAINAGDATDLQVVSEMQGRGIGGELQYLYRRANPDAPTGGLTEAGERSLARTYERLRDEGILSANRSTTTGAVGLLANESRAQQIARFDPRLSHSANLLAANASPGLGLLAASAPSEQEQLDQLRAYLGLLAQ